jgi:hypothetical protein
MDVFTRVIEDQYDLDIGESVFSREIRRGVELAKVASPLAVRCPFTRPGVVPPRFEVV